MIVSTIQNMKKKLNSESIDASHRSLQQLPSIDNLIDNAMVDVSGENLIQRRPMTIFYNGQVSVSNVTDVQACTILHHARREMEDRAKSPTRSKPPSPNTQPNQVHSPSSALSMKRSIEIFLQKRKDRIRSTSSCN